MAELSIGPRCNWVNLPTEARHVFAQLLQAVAFSVEVPEPTPVPRPRQIAPYPPPQTRAAVHLGRERRRHATHAGAVAHGEWVGGRQLLRWLEGEAVAEWPGEKVA